MNQKIEITNGALSLCCAADGTDVVVRDEKRELSWNLDEHTRVYRIDGERDSRLLGSGSAVVLGERAIRQEFEAEGEKLTFLWKLLEDGLEVELSCREEGERLNGVALPGSFLPEEGKLQLALPVMQGLLFDGRGEPFEDHLRYGGHQSLSMAMLGYLTERAGLLASIESNTDWSGTIGKRDDGTIYAHADQLPSLGRMGYERSVRLYPTDSGLTGLCRRYRRRVQERGGWKPWAEKIAERPVVERLFGALMAFVGYNQGEIDYAAECGKLRGMGFDRAFLYPVRFNTYSRDFKMGGDDPIHLTDGEIQAIKELGYDVAPWSWVYEALDDGSEEVDSGYSRDASGAKIPHWKIDQFQWYLCCTPFQTEFVERAYEGSMAEMTWTHYDVNATVGPRECYALDHPWHRGQLLDRRGDQAFLRDLLGPQTNGNRVVSSEGVRDNLADVYDIGSTKLLPSWGEAIFWTVPMTMLVFHDALVHDWWEVQNYNAAGHFDHVSRWGRKCDGFPRRKAAMDALYGCPPNVFPFGKQYRWVDIQTRKTESYQVGLEDPPVQEALAAALPVTQLHRRIGQLDMLEHVFLAQDGAVQCSEFADGTRVFANFAEEVREVEEIGELPGKSWKAV